MSTTLDDIRENPKKFGAPTFEEFSKNPKKYRKDKSKLNMVDNSLKILRAQIGKEDFWVKGVICKTTEELETVAKEEGIDVDQCSVEPQLYPYSDGKIHVRYYFREPKIKIEKKKLWVP